MFLISKKTHASQKLILLADILQKSKEHWIHVMIRSLSLFGIFQHARHFQNKLKKGMLMWRLGDFSRIQTWTWLRKVQIYHTFINWYYNFKTSGSDSYYSVPRNLWSSRLLSEILKIKTHKTILTALCVVMERTLKGDKNCVLWRTLTGVFWSGRDEITTILQ